MKKKYLIINFIKNLWFEKNLLEEFIVSRKIIFFPIFIFFIFLHQSTFFFNRVEINENTKIARQDASGFSHGFGQVFVYFHYHLNLFPIYSASPDKIQSTEGALKVSQNPTYPLMMEYQHWSRLGENLRIFLYSIKTFLTKSAEAPSIIPSNILIFYLALLAIIMSSFIIGKPIWGFILSLLIGSNPYLRHEIYANQNIFGWHICWLTIFFSCQLPFLISKYKRRFLKYLLMIIFTGLILGVITQVRSELKVLLAPIGLMIFTYFFVDVRFNLMNLRQKIPQFLLMIFILLVTFKFSNFLIVNYFDNKFREAKEFVIKNNGIPYEGHRIKEHPLWHPLACGLGDFDHKYDFKWDDKALYQRLIPILKNKHQIELKVSETFDYKLDNYYDQQSKAYYQKIDLYPEYEMEVKNLVLDTIKNDPIWYLQIIKARINRLLTHIQPVSFWLKQQKIFSIKLSKDVLVLFLLILAWIDFKLVFICLIPVISCLQSILIYSGGNNTFNNIYHYFIFSTLMYLLFNGISQSLIKRFTKRRIT